jgi:hypothetical protein
MRKSNVPDGPSSVVVEHDVTGARDDLHRGLRAGGGRLDQASAASGRVRARLRPRNPLLGEADEKSGPFGPLFFRRRKGAKLPSERR